MRIRRLGHLATILVLAGFSRVWGQTLPPEQQEVPPATQSQPATRPTVLEGRISSEELRSRLKAAEAAPDLAEDVRAKTVGLYQEAVNSIEQAEALRTKAAKSAEDMKAAPLRLEAIQVELAKPVPATPAAADLAAEMTPEQVDQQARQEDADLASAKSRLKELEDRLDGERGRPDELHRLITETKQRVEQIDNELGVSPPEGELAGVTEARREALHARRYLRQTELSAYAQELADHDVRLSLWMAERDLAARDVGEHEARAKAWQEAALRAREQDAARARQEAEQAEEKAAAMPPPVRELAQRTTALAKEAEELIAKETRLTQELDEVQTALQGIEEDFESAQQRVELVGLNETIALLLRKQRESLPNLRDYRRAARERQATMRTAAGAQFDADERLGALVDIDPLVTQVMGRLDPSVPEQVRATLPEEIKKLLRDQADTLRKLHVGYGRYLKQLGKLDNAERELVAKARRYGEFIDEHLLWIRSTAPVRAAILHETTEAIRWGVQSVHWVQVGGDVKASLRRAWGGWLFTVLLVAGLFAARPRARRELATLAQRVRKLRTDTFALTLRALLMTAILAAAWPVLIGFVGWRLASQMEASELTRAVGGGLMATAALWALFGAIRALCAKNGLAQVHFRWTETTRLAFRRHLLWVMAVSLPLSFVFQAVDRLDDEAFRSSLGRLAFVGVMLALAAFVGWVLRPRGPVVNAISEQHPGGWLTRFRLGWYVLLLAVPLGLAVLAVLGYFYTALQLEKQLEATGWLVLALVIIHEGLMRWLYVAQRKLAYEEAKRRREAARAEAEESAEGKSGSEYEPIVIEESEIDLEEINEDTRGLIRTLVGFAAVLGLWWAWATVLPALNLLDDVHLWSYTAKVEGVETAVPVTLANLALAVLVGTITILAAKNLPGAIDITLLNRLPMDAGARYAFSTICQYVITAIGVIVAFDALGVSWSSLQWLIAALSVGLGFGLQEIVANFVSGLIILFERPFRVGDIVKVKEVSGVVSRIRIRATTIIDWDRNELVVPNKRFITDELINSTLSTPMTRVVIPVGIAYGSDAALAKRLLLKLAQENPLVLDDPVPSALFLRFGDNSLNLELRVFLGNIKDRLTVTDELHEAINREFQQAGIEIVFPQQDVHLETTKPIEVRMLDSQTAPARTGDQ